MLVADAWDLEFEINCLDKGKKIERNCTRPKSLISTFASFWIVFVKILFAGRKDGYWAISPPEGEIVLIFSNFLRS